jgi:hypothetical protein
MCGRRPTGGRRTCRGITGRGTAAAWRSALCICEGAGNGPRRTSARQQLASARVDRKRFCPNKRTGRRRAAAVYGAGRNFQRFVVPHFCFSEQSPAFEGMKHRALTAQRFHCAVANEILHFSPPTCLPAHRLFKTYFKTVSLRFWTIQARNFSIARRLFSVRVSRSHR